MSALRLVNEFDIKIVLDGAAESYLLLDEIKAAKVPVIFAPHYGAQSGRNAKCLL